MTRRNKNKNKRPPSSPDNGGQPVKRLTSCEVSTSSLPSGSLSTSHGTSHGTLAYSPSAAYCTSVMASQGYVQPTNLSSMNINSYQTSPGTYYTPLAAPPPQPPQYAGTHMPIQSQQMTQQGTDSFQQFVVDRLNSMDKRLGKLDSIEQQLLNFSHKLTSMDNRVSSLESTAAGNNARFTEVEASRAFESQICDEIRTKQDEIDKSIKAERERISKFSVDHNSLKNMSKELTDLKSRSMRDNLLFFGFPEGRSVEDRRTENCENLVSDYCSVTLGITDKINFERVHRIGNNIDLTKPRPIVAKFSRYPDKAVVKSKVSDYVQARQTADGKSHDGSVGRAPSGPLSKIRVNDQFPKIIQERRKALIPTMIRARQDNKIAYLSYDKLLLYHKLKAK